MKFKGQNIRGPNRQYSLKEQLGQGGFSVLFSTNEPETICKVQVLSNPQISKAYKNQKSALQQLKHNNIVKLRDAFQLKEKDGLYGFLLMQNCSGGNAWNLLQSYGQNDLPQKLILKIGYFVCCALQQIHKRGMAHRDVKLENVLLTSKGQYKLCDFGSSSKEIIRTISKQSRDDIQEYIEKSTTPFYRSPQQLDLYSGFQIGPKVDIFALGSFINILGVLLFMLCFKKAPFQSRLSSINKQYFIPEEISYSPELISLIDLCFQIDPKKRISATELKSKINSLMVRKIAQLEMNLEKQLDNTLVEILKINNQMLKKNNTIAESSIFDKIKLIYSQITTQTEGWIASFVQDNQQSPQLKYNRSIISKCWQKRYKVQKIYQILFNYTEDYKSKSLVNLKLLILLHNFLRKGPPQSISYEGKFSPSKVTTKIYKNWKLYQRPTDTQDIKRNSYVCLLIRHYSLILTAKWKLCYENSDIIQGNFSILPFFQSTKEIPLLKLPFICQLVEFLNMCTEFHQIISTRSYLIQIQRSILLSLVDQEYCCVSLVVFLLCAFKQAICHLSDELDLEKLEQKLKFVEKDFQSVFLRLQKLFQSVNKLASLFEQEMTFTLSSKILQRIKRIKIRQKKTGSFQFNKHINYEKSIQGLRIPVSYEQAVKNPDFLKNLQKKQDQSVLQMNQFKLKKIEPQLSKRPKQHSRQRSQIAEHSLTPITSQTSQLSFKKNNDHKVFEEEQKQIDRKKTVIKLQKNQSISTQNNNESNLIKSSRINMMQFTHQNLNKDMNSSIIKKVTTLDNNRIQSKIIDNQSQFKDFLSIVDDKFIKAQFSSHGKHQQVSLKNDNQQIATQSKKQNNPKSATLNNIFNDFGTIADGTNSKISSINSNNNIWTKSTSPNIFSHPFQSLNTDNKSFQAFGTIISQQQKIKKSPSQVGKVQQCQISSKIQPNPNHNTVYSSISSISKDVFNTLNNREQQENTKVELMNFFDDEEEQKKPVQQTKKTEKYELLENQQNNYFLSKTSECLMKNQHLLQSNQEIAIKSQKKNIEEAKFNYSNEKLFNKSPGQHSFIDLKGFIVQQVKKNAQQYFIDFSTLKFFGKVGFGHSSQVFKGQWRGREVAIKRIKDNMSPSNAKEFRRQIMTSVKIRHHPNLVTLIGIAEYQNQYYIINEFCNGATLFDFLHESSHNISIMAKLAIAKQIAKGMLFLHTNDPPIIHRDLKSLNVLLVNKYNSQHEPQIKIADFGLSRDFASTYMTGTLGTYHWMAPEIFNNEPYSLKADVYSYGIPTIHKHKEPSVIDEIHNIIKWTARFRVNKFLVSLGSKKVNDTLLGQEAIEPALIQIDLINIKGYFFISLSDIFDFKDFGKRNRQYIKKRILRRG